MSGVFLEETMLGMTCEEIGKSVDEKAVVFLPVGVVEEHGPHLPLGTDIYLSLSQAIDVKKHWDRMGLKAVVAPPFYWGGVQALSRQFPGTFTSKKETIIASIYDILESLHRFGYEKVVLFNAHGDGLHIKALLKTIEKANRNLRLHTYWIEYEDDIENDGFTGNEEYLAIISPFYSERKVTCSREERDHFNVHAGGYETAMMLEECPENALYIQSHIAEMNEELAKGLAHFFQS